MTSVGVVMAGTYDYSLVALSALIAVLASYTALDLAGRVTAASGEVRMYWLIGGATAMGVGIWSMHITAMLAFTLPVPVLYDWPTVLVSLIPGILSSALALFVVSRGSISSVWAVCASIFMGGGIAALHYTSMAAMRLTAMCRYSPVLVTLSVAAAIAFSLISVELTFHFRGERTGQRLRKTASALAMGAAISVMHYTAMAAASFTPANEVPDLYHAVSISSLASVGIAVITLMMLGITLVTCLVDRLQKQTSLLDELFEQAPQAVALMNVDNRVVR